MSFGELNRAVIKSRLPGQIEFRRPPRFNPVLKLRPERMKIIALPLRSKCRKILDFQIAGFFHLVGVGDENGPSPAQQDGDTTQTTPVKSMHHERNISTAC